MSSSNQQEQLYRWVKASENNPPEDHSTDVIGRSERGRIDIYTWDNMMKFHRPFIHEADELYEWLEPYTPPVEEMKAEFNLNDYILVQITNYGWEELEKTKDQGFIEHCIKAKKEVINGVDYYKLQAHFVIETFGEMLWASFPSPLQPKILVPYKSQPSAPVNKQP